jgi:hypothetical protein
VEAYLSSADRARIDVVHSGYDELTDATNEHSDHEEDATATNLRDYATINDNSNDADGGQNA